MARAPAWLVRRRVEIPRSRAMRCVMPNERGFGLASRRGLLRGGALAGAAGAAALSLPAARALAKDTIDDSRLKTVLDRGKLLVGTGATTPPWHFEDDSGKLVGMGIDMAKHIAVGA